LRPRCAVPWGGFSRLGAVVVAEAVVAAVGVRAAVVACSGAVRRWPRPCGRPAPASAHDMALSPIAGSRTTPWRRRWPGWMQPAEDRLGLPAVEAIPPSEEHRPRIGAGCARSAADPAPCGPDSGGHAQGVATGSLAVARRMIFTAADADLASLNQPGLLRTPRSTHAFEVVMQGVPAGDGVLVGGRPPAAGSAGASQTPEAGEKAPLTGAAPGTRGRDADRRLGPVVL